MVTRWLRDATIPFKVGTSFAEELNGLANLVTAVTYKLQVIKLGFDHLYSAPSQEAHSTNLLSYVLLFNYTNIYRQEMLLNQSFIN